MLLATMFVTLPFIVRELIPTLEQMDLAQEEAAKTLGANPLQVRQANRWPTGPGGHGTLCNTQPTCILPFAGLSLHYDQSPLPRYHPSWLRALGTHMAA
jgi:hypothetical protein